MAIPYFNVPIYCVVSLALLFIFVVLVAWKAIQPHAFLILWLCYLPNAHRVFVLTSFPNQHFICFSVTNVWQGGGGGWGGGGDHLKLLQYKLFTMFTKCMSQ